MKTPIPTTLSFMGLKPGEDWRDGPVSSLQLPQGPLTTEELEQLRAVCEAATGGQWNWEEHGIGWALYSGRSNYAHGLNILTAPATDAWDSNGVNNRRFMEAANPHTILRLLEMLSAESVDKPAKTTKLRTSRKRRKR